jgi:hypothetical protein
MRLSAQYPAQHISLLIDNREQLVVVITIHYCKDSASREEKKGVYSFFIPRRSLSSKRSFKEL